MYGGGGDGEEKMGMVGGGGGGGGGEGMMKMMTMTMSGPTSSGQWGPEETRELIAIRGELETRDSNVAKRSKALWEAVSCKMAETGFNRTPEQCKCKWKNLLIRYKGKETSDPETGRECPFFEELQAVFTERARNMQRLLLGSEAGSAQPKKRVTKKSKSVRSSDDFSEDLDEGGEDCGNGKGKKTKVDRVVVARGGNAASGTSSTSSIPEMVKAFFQQQQRMEVEWREMLDRRAQERRMFELEWRQRMEKLERERLMVEQAWREREEQRKMREESRAERRDALLTTLLNRLIDQI